jgi:probable phosphoglycerate mutase
VASAALDANVTRVTPGQLWLVRHGETEWSAAGRHTGRTDLRLTDAGRAQARALAGVLAGHSFAAVRTSPLERARETSVLAGFGDRAVPDVDLVEWDYGDYEGQTTAHIQASRPGWSLWDDGCPGGETADDVGARADRVIATARAEPGDVAVFAHGHLLRVLAARWLGLHPGDGALFALDTASVSVLGWEHDDAVIRQWNLRQDSARSSSARRG